MSEHSRREILPAGPPERGVLYVAPPLAHTRGTIRRLLLGSGLDFDDPLEDVLSVEVCPAGLGRLSELLLGGLSETELADCQAVLVERGAPVGLDLLPRMQSLFNLVCGVQGGWLAEMLRDGRLAVHFQPIVRVGDPGEVFAYECLLRGVGERGDLINPRPMFEAARRAGLLFNLDRAARVRAIEEAAAHGLRETAVFVNFDSGSIYDPSHCLGDTMAALKSSGLAPDKVVFEVIEGDKVEDDARLRDILDCYRNAGCKVALDDLGSGYGSLDLMAALSPDFVKLDMTFVRDHDPYRATIARNLIEFAHDLGVTVVAEGVETEEQLRWLADHDAHYAQGNLFASPASPPPVPARAYA